MSHWPWRAGHERDQGDAAGGLPPQPGQPAGMVRGPRRQHHLPRHGLLRGRHARGPAQGELVQVASPTSRARRRINVHGILYFKPPQPDMVRRRGRLGGEGEGGWAHALEGERACASPWAAARAARWSRQCACWRAAGLTRVVGASGWSSGWVAWDGWLAWMGGRPGPAPRGHPAAGGGGQALRASNALLQDLGPSLKPDPWARSGQGRGTNPRPLTPPPIGQGRGGHGGEPLPRGHRDVLVCAAAHGAEPPAQPPHPAQGVSGASGVPAYVCACASCLHLLCFAQVIQLSVGVYFVIHAYTHTLAHTLA